LTLVVPLVTAVPLAGVQVTLAVPQLSAAVALKVTLLEQVPGAVSTVMLAGQAIIGFSWSSTVTLKLQAALLPLPSSAVQLTVVVPLAKAEPLAGVQVTLAVPQLSEAVALKVTLLAQVPGAVFTVMLAGQTMLGFS